MIAWLFAALAQVPVSLPEGEPVGPWRSAFELAGLEQARSPGAAVVRIRITGADWQIVARAPDGRERRETVPAPTDAVAREELALVAMSLCRDLGLARTPEAPRFPEPTAPPPPPPPPPPVVEPVDPDPVPAPEPVRPAPRPASVAPDPAPQPEPDPPAPEPIAPAPEPIAPAPEPIAPAPEPIAPTPEPDPVEAPAPAAVPVPEPVVPELVTPVPEPIAPAPPPSVEPTAAEDPPDAPEPVPEISVEPAIIDVLDPPSPRQRRVVAIPGLRLGVGSTFRPGMSPTFTIDAGIVPVQSRWFELELGGHGSTTSFLRDRHLWRGFTIAGVRALGGVKPGSAVTIQGGVDLSMYMARQQSGPFGSFLVPRAVVGTQLNPPLRWRGIGPSVRAHTLVDLVQIELIDEFGVARRVTPVSVMLTLVIEFSGFGDPKRTLPTLPGR